MKLWSPFHKKLSIAGIQVQSEVIRSSGARLDAVAYQWSPILGEGPFDKKILCSRILPHSRLVKLLTRTW